MADVKQATMLPNTDEFVKVDDTTFHLYDFLINGIATIGGYQISDSDILGAIHYYGYLLPDAKWYILKEDTTGAVYTYRYCKGDAAYIISWNARVGLVYDYFCNIF